MGTGQLKMAVSITIQLSADSVTWRLVVTVRFRSGCCPTVNPGQKWCLETTAARWFPEVWGHKHVGTSLNEPVIDGEVQTTLM